MQEHQLIPHFLSGDALARLVASIDAVRDRSVETKGSGGIAPRYRVMDGQSIALHLSELLARSGSSR